MTQMLHLLTAYLTLSGNIGHIQSLQQNHSCEYGSHCTKASDRQAMCPPGHYRPGTELEESHQCLKCPVHFFNHMVEQKACFSCGSEATQPEEGQSTCICRGEGRVFQPSDRRCPCSPGYHLTDDGVSCVQIVHDICRDGANRNNEGKCLTKQEWTDYCSNQVCTLPEHYQGYDKFLGICICQTEELDSICNADCRRKEKHSLQLICLEDTPQLMATDSSGEKVPIRREDREGVIVFDNPVEKFTCSSKPSSVYSVYVVKSSEQGFWGVYNTNPKEIKHLLGRHANLSLSNVSENIPYRSDKIDGILNPTTCIHVNDFIMFIASKNNYPMYDVNNLYNTNPELDWGPFRTLAEEVWLSSKPLFSFLFQFQEPGVYVLKLSSNHYKKMYIRVMLVGGQCYQDGPFFPTTPGHVIRNGIAQMPPLLLKPDWPAIAGIITGLTLILITCVLLLVWFRDLGWTPKTVGCPKFRNLQLKFNLDSYSSKGSTVMTSKKLHPRMRIKGQLDKTWNETDRRRCQKFIADDEFWDYEQQIDMESFNAHMFYDILLKQSFLVTSKLGQLKEEVKVFYEKLVYEVSTLKETFVKHLSITGYPKLYSSSIVENYIQNKQEVEIEVGKRKRLAAEYEDILNKQLHMLQEDMKSQEEHCVVFEASLRESARLLELMKENTSESGGDEFANKWQKYVALFDASCNTMYNAVMKESNRLKVWSVLGEDTGAYLVNKDRTRLLSKRDLIALDGSVQESEFVSVDPVLGLITPKPHSVMLLSSNYLTPVPSGFFLHSDTGKVLPIAGNVGYDPATSQLISTVDSALGKIWKTGRSILPYVNYPVNPSTGLPVDCKLSDLHQAQCENFTRMVDPTSGLEVPILAVTRHPRTRQWLAVAGTYMHPLTNTLSPIEIGGPMVGARGKLYPVLGVGIDNTTGDVVPLGGLVSSSGSISVLGDIFHEPLSGKKVRLQGAIVQEDKVAPHAGGYQALLDSNLMMAQIAVIDKLKAHRELFSEDLPVVKEEFEHASTALTKALESMKKAATLRNQHVISKLHNVTSQLKMAVDIKLHGGNLGLIRYHKTELWIPAVLGMEIPDPGPSDMMVPILGVEHDFSKGHLVPLAGTMEDYQGTGLIPIKIGARTIDPTTGCSCPVVGAQINPLTGVIIPVVQTLGTLKDKDYYLLEALQNELTARETFWQNQRSKEEELLKELNVLTLYVLDVAREGNTHKIRFRDRILSLDEAFQSLEEESLCEAQRRASCNLNTLSIKMSQLPFIGGDITEEKEQQLIFSLVVRKTTEKLMEFTDKLVEESERVSSQLREWQKSREQTSEDIVKTKEGEIMLHLIDEFEDHIMKRLTGVDVAYCRLEYVREHCKIQGLLAKSYLLGTSLHYINPQATYWNVTGKQRRNIGEMLIPILKHLIQVVEENKTSVLPSETQAPVSGYSSRSTLKASAANSDNFQVSANASDKSKSSGPFPWLSNELFYGHQGYLFRFLTEKQATELVHLERILLAEEISRIWSFCESYNVQANLWGLISQDKDKQKQLVNDQNMSFEWDKLIKELTDVHRTALKALCEKHQEEAKRMGLDPDTVIPANYFTRDVTAAIEEVAVKMQSVYQQLHRDKSQEMSSGEAKLFTTDKDSQSVRLRTIAAKYVRQELLIQIHVYNILDAYNGVQADNCVKDVQEILSQLFSKSCYGKSAAEEAANIMEQQYVEKLIQLLKKSYKEQQSPLPLSEMQSQLKEEHCVLTEQLLQEKDTLLLKEMAGVADTRNYMDHIVCYVLTQRHLRQVVMLLQEGFRTQTQDQEKVLRTWDVHDCAVTGNCQEEILNLFNNKEEAKLLLTDMQHTIRRIQLRERHLGEIAQGLKEFCSDKVHILTYVEEAHYLENELQAFVQQQLKRLKEELKELSKSLHSKEEMLGSEKIKETIADEREFLKRLQEKQAEEEQAHRRQISEECLKLQDQLERGELNGFMKQKLIKEHDESIAFLEKTLQRDLEKLNVKLQSELCRGKRPPGTTLLNMEAPTGKINSQSNDQKILSLLADNISIFQQADQIAAARITLLGSHLDTTVLPPAPADGDTSNILESSPMLTLLKEVDSQLRASAQSAKLMQSSNKLDQKNTFTDVEDLQSPYQGDLSPVRPEDLSAREFVIYQYGTYILQLLKSHINIGELDLHVATCLPGNSYKGNAFSRSFFYQSSENELFVLRGYLQSAGSFVLLIIHCICHIASGGFDDDADPFFLRNFYQAVRICLTEGFFTRFQLSSLSHDHNNSRPSDDNILPKEETFSKNTDFISKLIAMKFESSNGKSLFKQFPKTSEETMSQYEIEAILKNKLAQRKREFFNPNDRLKNCSPKEEENDKQLITAEHLHKALDTLNAELMKVLQKEIELQRNISDIDKKCFHKQILALEKECLIKNIVILEEKITFQNSLV
ncbi:uncharacterized protein LOC134965294 [Pseudophryne corroboree]|uniref:uncharacterized protein LOC134965294 n=1 Tax=Pseudophryne corroboree TaxID=495146 RepID=UPI003081FCDF